MSSTDPILIASANRGKLREFQAILAGTRFKFVLPADLAISLEVVEDGLTYAENAALKARAYCAASGLVCMADDSGLEVDALNGQPGLYSARYSPKPGASDADRGECCSMGDRNRFIPNACSQRPQRDFDGVRPVGHTDAVLDTDIRRKLLLEGFQLSTEHVPATF